METEQNKVTSTKSQNRHITALVLLCVVILSGVGIYYGIDTGFFERAYYEIQSQITGKIEFEMGTYSGETDFGIMSGNGTFQFVSGEYYEGSWVNDQIEGFGVISHPDAGQYEGEFSESQKTGIGTFTWVNGDQYVGSWENDTLTGNGVYIFADGSVLDGTFEANQFISGTYSFDNETGNYVVTYRDGSMILAKINFADGSIYSGSCSDGLISGYGEIKYPNGDTYKGDYKAGKRNGEGIYNWSIGDSYSGEWKNDEMYGTGTYKFNTGEVLDGLFKDNCFISGSYKTSTEAGSYTFVLENSKPIALEMKLENGFIYDGEFSNNNLNGRGTLTYPSGDEYIGEFVNGVRSGDGIYTWKNGACYTGSWSNDLMNGRGTYYYSDDSEGYKLVGTFVDNKPDGECTYYLTSSRSYGTTWRNGKCVKVTE